VKYVVFVPHAFDVRQEHPAILFLHGLGQSGDAGKVQAERGLGQVIREQERKSPFIAIFSQSQQRSWPADSADGRRAVQILEVVQREYNVDARRIYLTGYSMGGDDLSAVNQTRAMLRAIADAGGRPIHHEFPGVGHNCWDLTCANADLYEWLLTQRQPR